MMAMTTPTPDLASQLAHLRPDQAEIALHPAPVKVVACGRRYGKTVMAGSLCLAVARLGGAVAWVVPTFRNARPVWRMAEAVTAPFVKAGAAQVHRAERTITFRGAGWLGVYTADNPVGILGEAFDLVVMEEAARVAEEVWTETLQPTLADNGGHGLLISTPRGLNWFHREWLRGVSGEPGYASWQRPSTGNPNPNILRAADLARDRVPDITYRQEWLAEFLSGTGAVFRHVNDAATAMPAAPRDGRDYVVGIDLARVTDYTVACVLDTGTGDDDAKPTQVHLDRFHRVDWDVQLDRLTALAVRYLPRVVVVDRTGIGDMPYMKLAERLSSVAPHTVVRGVKFTAANKMAMVQDLARGFEGGRLRILSDQTPEGAVQYGELLSYAATERATGALSYNAPAGGHDDTCVALMLAWSVASPDRVMVGRLAR